MTVPKVFVQLCRRHPDKIAFYYENETWTFQQVRVHAYVFQLSIKLEPEYKVSDKSVLENQSNQSTNCLLCFRHRLYKDEQLTPSEQKKNPHGIQEDFVLQVEEYSNQVANYFKGAGFKRGDSIALFMENSVVFVGIWLGLSKIGVITGLINSNLKGKPLIHSIEAANSKALIFSKDLKQG